MRAVVFGVMCVAAAGCRIGFDDVALAGPDAPSGSPAAIQFVQSNGIWRALDAIAVPSTFAAPIGAHHAVIAAINIDNPAISLVGVTDTAGNVYTQVLGPIDDGGIRFYLLVALDTAPGATTVTATYSAIPGNAGELFISEYSGVAATDALDAVMYGVGASFGQDAMLSGAITIHDERELLFGYGVAPCTQVGTGVSLRTDIHGDITEDTIVDAGSRQLTATGSCPGTGDRWRLFSAALRPARI